MHGPYTCTQTDGCHARYFLFFSSSPSFFSREEHKSSFPAYFFFPSFFSVSSQLNLALYFHDNTQRNCNQRTVPALLCNIFEPRCVEYFANTLHKSFFAEILKLSRMEGYSAWKKFWKIERFENYSIKIRSQYLVDTKYKE